MLHVLQRSDSKPNGDETGNSYTSERLPEIKERLQEIYRQIVVSCMLMYAFLLNIYKSAQCHRV